MALLQCGHLPYETTQNCILQSTRYHGCEEVAYVALSTCSPSLDPRSISALPSALRNAQFMTDGGRRWLRRPKPASSYLVARGRPTGIGSPFTRKRNAIPSFVPFPLLPGHHHF